MDWSKVWPGVEAIGSIFTGMAAVLAILAWRVQLKVRTEYAAAMHTGTEFPPIDVFYDGSEYWLADGFHRVLGAGSAGIPKISANVHQGDLRSAILFSVGANSSHGMRRSNEDKRRAVTTMLTNDRVRLDDKGNAWSDNKIAKQCGVHHQLVGTIRKELSLDDSSSEPRSYTTKHGTTAVMNTSNIGRKSVTSCCTFFSQREDASGDASS